MTNKIEIFPLILLAGGRSSRMGTPKGLLDYHGHSWLVEQLKRFKAASGRRAFIVLGFHQSQYFDQIPWMEKAVTQSVQQLGLGISAAINPTPEHGQFSSLQCAIAYWHAHHPSPSPLVGVRTRTGRQPSPTRGEGERFTSSPLRSLRAGRDRGGGGAFILPIDVPCPAKEVFEKLTAAFYDLIDVAIPQYQSRGGHPVLLSAQFLGRLAVVPPTSPQARLDFQIKTLPSERTTFVPVEDKNICLNMNSVNEFQNYTRTEEASFQA